MFAASVHWMPGPWSACLSHSGAHCGFGEQTRNVSCVVFPSWPRQPAPAHHCHALPAPPTTRLCAVHCGGCRAAAWSGWSECDCQAGLETRTRHLQVGWTYVKSQSGIDIDNFEMCFHTMCLGRGLPARAGAACVRL